MGLASANLQAVFNGMDLVSLKPIRNIMFYKCVVYDPTNRDTQANLGSAIAAQFNTQFLPLLSDQYSFDSLMIRNLDDPFDMGESAAGGGAGAVSGDYLPSDNAVVVNWMSAYRGKQGRGKTHFALVPESATSGNVLTSGAITAWKAAAAAWFASTFTGPVGLNFYALYIFNATATAGNFTPSGIQSVPVISYKLNKMIGGMKRRKQRGVYA